MWFAFFIFAATQKIYIMGRGDKKSKKGKIFKGSFGKSRPARPAAAKKKAAAAQKASK
jgi:30S ribosomal protein S31